MKYLIVSEIHGAFGSAEFIINEFNKEKCDYILLVGDV
jgi:predicted phosphodiesterase